jgi:hypothetical protein
LKAFSIKGTKTNGAIIVKADAVMIFSYSSNSTKFSR